MKELTTMWNTSDITRTSAHLGQKIEAQRAQKAMLTTINESRDFDMIR